jgi:hypothetical protein
MKYECLLGVLDFSTAIQHFDEKSFALDQNRSAIKRIRQKFILISFLQKTIIPILCFGYNSSPILVHYFIIGIKISAISLYFIFKPYIHCFFDFFKIL